MNVICLLAKWYVWRNRFHSRQFKLKEFINELKLQIAADANKFNDISFEVKWGKYLHILES